MARRAIEATEVSRCWSWEQYAVAGPFPPMDMCLDEVKRSDVLVLLMGRDLTENTRQEYDLAAELGIPRVVFVKEGRMLGQTRTFLKSIQSDITYEKFQNLNELEALVRNSLLMNMAHALRSQRGRPMIASYNSATQTALSPRRVL